MWCLPNQPTKLFKRAPHPYANDAAKEPIQSVSTELRNMDVPRTLPRIAPIVINVILVARALSVNVWVALSVEERNNGLKGIHPTATKDANVTPAARSGGVGFGCNPYSSASIASIHLFLSAQIVATI